MSHIKEKSYIDVTTDWILHSTPNSGAVKEMFCYEYRGKKYYVDHKNVVLDYGEKELEVANWLKGTFGGEIYMCPRINNPEGIKTPDYIFNGIKLDLKKIIGSGKRTVDTSIKQCKKQANNFVIDISDSKLKITEVLSQIKKIYNSAGREWINILIIKKHSKLIAVYKKRS